MDQERPILDLHDHHTIVANKRGAIPPTQRAAIVQFLSAALQSSIATTLGGQHRTPWGFRYPYRVKRALDHGQVAAIEGEITLAGQFQPTATVAQPLALRFPTWSGAPGELAPGRYQLFYLQGADFVLSAQFLSSTPDAAAPTAALASAGPVPSSLAPASPVSDAAPPASVEDLARANGFDLTALSANRERCSPIPVCSAPRPSSAGGFAWAWLAWSPGSSCRAGSPAVRSPGSVCSG